MARSTWFLLHCDSDDSHSIVESSFVMNADCVQVNDEVTFFYGGKSYVGQVNMISENRDKLDEQLNILGKKAKRSAKPRDNSCHDKRRSTAPKRLSLSPKSDSVPEKKKKGKSTKALAKERKDIGWNAMNHQVLNATGNDTKALQRSGRCDTSSTHIIDSASDEDEIFSHMKEAKVKHRKALISNIIRVEVEEPEDAAKAIKKDSGNKGKLRSPSKEDLQQRLFIAEAKISYLSKLTSEEKSVGEAARPSTSTLIATDDREASPVSCSKVKATDNRKVVSASSSKLKATNDGEAACTLSSIQKASDNSTLSDELFGSDNLSDNDSSDSKLDSNKGSFVKGSSDDNFMPSPSSEEKDLHCDEDHPDQAMYMGDQDFSQLLGKHFKDSKMVLLMNDIYCRKDVLDAALKKSSNASHSLIGLTDNN